MHGRIDDGSLKEAVSRYVGGDGEAYRSIVEVLSGYIYNYPRIVFGSDGDTCGGFYEYVLERMGGILGKYRVTGAKFLTWFTVVLRNRYLNFVREEKGRRMAESQVRVVSLDGECGSRRDVGAREGSASRSLHEVIGDGRYVPGERAGHDELVEGIVRNLKPAHRVYFHLYYLETMRPEDLSFLAIHLGRSASSLLHGLREVRCGMEDKYRLRSRLERRLSDLFYDLLRGQREGNRDLAGRAKKKRDKVLDEYRRVKLNPSYESIAKFLGLPVGTVSTGIMRMRRAAQTILEESDREKMPLQ